MLPPTAPNCSIAKRCMPETIDDEQHDGRDAGRDAE